MIKTLFEKKNCKIIDIQKHVSHIAKNDFEVSSIQNSENIEKSLLSFIKQEIGEILLFIIRIYIVV